MSRYIAISALVLFLSGCVVLPKSEADKADWRDIKVGGVPLKVELALTEKEQIQGLSGHESLAPGTGMLFKFAQADKYTFWMKDMKFALDFLWIRQSRVVQIDTNIPPPNQDFPEPKTLRANQPVDAVIEVLAGWVGDQGIELGDIMEGI